MVKSWCVMVCHDGHLPKNVRDQGNNKFNSQPWWPITADHSGPWLTMVNFCHGRPWSTMFYHGLVNHGWRWWPITVAEGRKNHELPWFFMVARGSFRLGMSQPRHRLLILQISRSVCVGKGRYESTKSIMTGFLSHLRSFTCKGIGPIHGTSVYSLI